MNWEKIDENGLCVSIFLKNLGWYLGVIEKLQNDECLIYIFTGKVQNGTPIIFNETLYRCWYKELRNNFSPVMVDTPHKNVHF